MDRRTFLATTAAAATAASLKAASAASVPATSQTGAPTLQTEPLPWDRCRGADIQNSHLESAHPAATFGPAGFPAFAGTMAVERVATGFRWAEGPVYIPAWRMVMFSDIPNNRIMQLLEDDGHCSVYRQPSMNSNGNTIDREGRLITCEHSGRRVTRTELDSSITIIADSYNGKKLNSPNDVVVASDGWDLVHRSGLRHRRLSMRASKPSRSRTSTTSTGSIQNRATSRLSPTIS